MSTDEITTPLDAPVVDRPLFADPAVLAAGVPCFRSVPLDRPDRSLWRPGERIDRTDAVYRTEIARLHAEVTALQRALASERRDRQRLIDRYERLLEDRDGEDTSSSGPFGLLRPFSR